MKKHLQKGFTLIETIIYLALFAIFLGGAVATAYNMFEASGRNQTKNIVQEEGNFLIAKIEWALAGTQIVNSPLANNLPCTLPATPCLLALNKITGLDPITKQPIITRIEINLAGTDMVLIYPDNIPPNSFILNNSSVRISNFAFTHNVESGSGGNSESVRADFTLTTNTPNGMQISQDFSTTKYLRK
jgi:prepilin-type N-terminal cleavage/methylation domain-containing protein